MNGSKSKDAKVISVPENPVRLTAHRRRDSRR